MSSDNILEMERDFQNAFSDVLALDRKADSLRRRGYKISIRPYRIYYGDDAAFSNKIVVGPFWPLERTLVKWFNIEYTFKDVPGAYRALEEIAEKLVSQLEIINSSIKQENISGKISDYKKSFNQIMKEMGS